MALLWIVLASQVTAANPTVVLTSSLLSALFLVAIAGLCVWNWQNTIARRKLSREVKELTVDVSHAGDFMNEKSLERPQKIS